MPSPFRSTAVVTLQLWFHTENLVATPISWIISFFFASSLLVLIGQSFIDDPRKYTHTRYTCSLLKSLVELRHQFFSHNSLYSHSLVLATEKRTLLHSFFLLHNYRCWNDSYDNMYRFIFRTDAKNINNDDYLRQLIVGLVVKYCDAYGRNGSWIK